MPPRASAKNRDLKHDPALAARLIKRDETPREKSRARKMDKILSVAVAVFAGEGGTGFSMRRIAENAGITLSTLQHYFGNRDALLALTIDALLTRYVTDYIDIGKDPTMSPRQRLEWVLDDLLLAGNDPVARSFYANLWATAAQDPAVRDIARESYRRYYEALGNLVAALRPDLSAEHAEALGLAIAAQMEGFLICSVMAPRDQAGWAQLTVNAKAVCFAMIENAGVRDLATQRAPRP